MSQDLTKVKILAASTTSWTDEQLKYFWNELGDIGCDDYGMISDPFYDWPAGTDREEIWQWFDQKHSFGVIKLMGVC